MPAGMPKIEVTFLIDANGILQVQARELRTGKAATIEVKPTYGLTEAQVEQMVEDSFTHAEADVNARLLIETQTEADTVINHVERALRRRAHLADREELRAIEARLAALRGPSGGHGPRRDPRAHHRAQPGDRAARGGDDGGRDQGRGRLASAPTRSWSRPDGDAQGHVPAAQRDRRGGRRASTRWPITAGRARCSTSRSPTTSTSSTTAAGSCACTTCHVIVREGEENLSPMEQDEEDRLDTAEGLTLHSRLGCQAMVQGDVVVEIPK